jgi:toxin ParE1/3/4
MSCAKLGKLAIFWSFRARTDLQEIAAYIARDDVKAADRWVARLIAAVERGGSFPLSGRMVPEFGREEIRETLLKNYRVVYRVEEGRIIVLTVFEGHRLLRGANQQEDA